MSGVGGGYSEFVPLIPLEIPPEPALSFKNTPRRTSISVFLHSIPQRPRSASRFREPCITRRISTPSRIGR